MKMFGVIVCDGKVEVDVRVEVEHVDVGVVQKHK